MTANPSSHPFFESLNIPSPSWFFRQDHVQIAAVQQLCRFFREIADGSPAGRTLNRAVVRHIRAHAADRKNGMEYFPCDDLRPIVKSFEIEFDSAIHHIDRFESLASRFRKQWRKFRGSETNNLIASRNLREILVNLDGSVPEKFRSEPLIAHLHLTQLFMDKYRDNRPEAASWKQQKPERFRPYIMPVACATYSVENRETYVLVPPAYGSVPAMCKLLEDIHAKFHGSGRHYLIYGPPTPASSAIVNNPTPTSG